VTNATTDQVAYTGFETADIYQNMNNWNFYSGAITTADHVTGNVSYDLSLGDLSRSYPQNANVPYVVSFWGKNCNALVNSQSPTTIGDTVNGWTYYEYLLQNANGGYYIEIWGSGLIDEVRLYPQSAQMETYTYNPLVGVSATCDVANHINYYEYDKMGRLIVIRDQNGNIVKKVDYAIQAQD